MLAVTLILGVIDLLLKHKRTKVVTTQTDPVMVNTRSQTDSAAIPKLKVKNKTLKPKRFLHNKSRYHKDWFMRKFYMKNKCVIHNDTDMELTILVKPRNILSTFGIKSVSGSFNDEYEEETYSILPYKKLKLRNMATYRFYLKLTCDDHEIAKRLCCAGEDIFICTL